jgi:urease accessory protein
MPFVTAAFDEPGRVDEIDRLCDVFTTNHIANRASRLQGQALRSAAARIFKIGESDQPGHAPNGDANRIPGPVPGHFAPHFGAITQRLRIPRTSTVRLFLFSHVRTILAAAVRLNIAGPMETQAMQHLFSKRAEQIARRCETLTLDDLTQTSPLLDIWQGTHSRLYSRLFQS